MFIGIILLNELQAVICSVFSKRCYITVSLFSILSLSMISYGQINNNCGYVGLSVGPAIPMGLFGSKDYKDGNIGFAKTGIRFNLVQGGYTFYKGFGVSMSLFGAAHTADNQYVNDRIWGYGGIMAGPMFTYEVNESVIANSKVLFGRVNSSIYQNNSLYESKQSMCIEFAANLLYKFSKNWCLLANIELFHCKAKFDSFNLRMTSISPTIGLCYWIE